MKGYAQIMIVGDDNNLHASSPTGKVIVFNYPHVCVCVYI